MIKQTYLILSILLGICLTACQDNDIIDNSSIVDGNMVEVTIKTNVPAITVQTRADASKNEKKLSHVDVLVFEVDNQNNETFAYRTTHSNNLDALEYDNEIEIKAKLEISQNSERYRIVFLANLKDEVKAFFGENGQVYEGSTSKKDILENLTFTQEKIWADTDAEPHPLPMWGESEVTTVTENMPSLTINLLRSVARIGLSVSISDNLNNDGSGVFDIKSVRVYNARKTGLAAPGRDLTEGKVTSPSLVNGSAFIDTENTDNANYILPDNSGNKVTGIYINEGSNQTEGEEVFLIIKAIYKKEDPTNQQATFYKVGFYDDNKNPVDILRNYTYNMVITSVTGAGEDNEEDAVNSATSNLTVSMTNWSGGDMKYVVFNGKNFLAVSESTLEISRATYTHEILVQTNYPGGWKAEVTTEDDWIIDFTPREWAPSASDPEPEQMKIPLSFKVSENNEDKNREGTIKITCGNNHLSLDVKVIQTTKEEYSLTILINNPDYPDIPGAAEYIEFDRVITFHSGAHRPISPRTVKVIWEPARMPLKVDFTEYFAWGDETNIDAEYNDGTGTATFPVVPARLLDRTPEDWYPEAMGDIQVQIGEDNTTKQNILIRRRHHEVYIEKADRYVVGQDSNEKPHQFKLYTNTYWQVEGYSDSQQPLIADILELNKPFGDYNLGDGEDIPFKINYTNTESLSEDISFTIEFWDVDDWHKKEYTLHVYYDNPQDEIRLGEEANCYVLHAGSSRGVSIPVSQANHSPYNTNKIVAGQELRVKYIWTDNENGLGKANSPVKSATIDNPLSGANAKLIVEPGSEPGNAVIAVTNSNGDIHWSWHIWVVPNDGFDPYHNDESLWKSFRYYQFMDRNLGALSNTPGSQESMGLYYQWGRKDPFPSARAIRSLDFSPMYNENGGPENIINWTPKLLSSWSEMEALSTQGNNNNTTFMFSLQNPNVMICPASTGTWFTHYWVYENATKQFWNEMSGNDLSTAKKGLYDPCPEGWKTVPGGTSGHNDWDTDFKYVTYDAGNNYSDLNVAKGDLGIWPHTGYIDGTTGKLTLPELGTYWTGGFNSHNESFRIQLNPNGQTQASVSLNAKAALPVRCMRRIDRDIE